MEFSKSGILSGYRIVRPSGRRRQCAGKARLSGGTAVLLAALALGGCQTIAEGPHGWLADAFGDSSAATADQDAGSTTAPAEMTTATADVHARYLGSVAADDPQAVDAGRRMLASRGTAADAAAAMGLVLTVTLPSRAGLDGGGVCLVHEPGQTGVQELDFVPPAIPGGQAQIPGLVRGLALLQTRDGLLHWQQAVGFAEKQAQTGIAVTPLLFGDLNAIGMAGGLTVGDVLPQRSAAATLARLRVAGASDFHVGELAQRLVALGVPATDLAKWVPAWRQSAFDTTGETKVFVPDGAGGKLAQAAWRGLTGEEPQAAFTAARGGRADDAEATTSFLAIDARGMAVSCAIGLGKMFGTGKLIPGLDVYAATPLDAAALAPIVALTDDQVSGVFSGGGGSAAPADTAVAAWLVLTRGVTVDAALAAPRSAVDTAAAHGADRLNAAFCPEGSPRSAASCIVAADPRGSGFAMSVDRF